MDNQSNDVDVASGSRLAEVDSSVRDARLIRRRGSPGWPWLIAVVLVSLALWAGIIWVAVRVISRFA